MNPPCLIGGSTPPWGPLSSGAGQGFDAYCATIYTTAVESLVDELHCLLDSAGFDPRVIEGGKARFYSTVRSLVDDKGKQLIAIKSGGSNPHPHVECYGRASDVLADYLRSGFDHRPTRIDHAVDRRAPGLFDQLHRYAEGLCREHGLRGEPDGDWITADAGRTFYIGSRKSQVSVRIYEKGLKYAKDLGLPVTDELREWVRIELEFKPQTKPAKALGPSIDGPRLWGSTIWTSQLAKEVLDMATEPVCIRERRESNSERALRFMGTQYSSHLRVLLDQCGGDMAEFGRAIADLANLETDERQDAA